MRTLFYFMLVAAVIAVRDIVAQGFSPSFDHSVAIRDLASDEKEKRRAVPISLPLPAYPFEMMRANLSGEVAIKFLVREDGTAGEAHVISTSFPEFAEPVKEVVPRWKFQPVNSAGAPTVSKVWMTCRVIFKMEDE
jgi:TonB family protein